MNMHTTPAERLLAMLHEDGAVETLPAGDVRDGLAAFGVDPVRSIAFAHALARDDDSPGGRLMGAVLAGEEEDDEIARIESADIDEVSAKIPGGAAAAIAAEARRKSGIDGNVVGLQAKRRKRRRLIVWGGPLAGIAASLLVVVIGIQMLRDPLRRAFETTGSYLSSASSEADYPPEGIQAERSAGDAGQAQEKTFADSAPATPAEEMLALNEPAAQAPAAGDKKSAAPPQPEAESRKREQSEALPPPAMPAPSREQSRGGGAAAGAPESPDALGGLGEVDTAADLGPLADAPQSAESPGSPEIVAPPGGSSAEQTFGAETDIAAAPPAGPGLGAGLLRNVEISEITAVLVVDPSQASLQIQSQILPPGGLAERVEEASRLAGDRPVIALYTVTTGPARRDFAQVPLQAGLSQQRAAPAPLVGLLGVAATEYDFIALPAE